MVKLVDQCFLGVDELVDDLHEWCDLSGAGLVDLLKDFAVSETFLVAVDELVVPNADAGVAILKEPVGVVPQPLSGLHGHPPEVEGISRAIVGHLKVRSEGLGQVGSRRDAACGEVVEPKRRCVAHHQREVGHHVVEVAASRLDSDVVGRQPDVGVRAAIVLLDIWLEVVGVGDRSETWCQREEGSDRHVVAVVADLGGDVVLCCSHDLGSGLAVWVRHRTFGVAVICFILSASPVLDVVAIAFFALHDLMDGARGPYSRSYSR
jgi:hypothetical protein